MLKDFNGYTGAVEPRPYRPSDRDACLAGFDSNNLPGRPAFESFLDDPSNLTVLEHEGAAHGGIELRSAACMCWLSRVLACSKC